MSSIDPSGGQLRPDSSTPDETLVGPAWQPPIGPDPRSARDSLPAELRTPERAIKPEYLVAAGICTHLGCSPTLVAAGTSNPSVGNNWQGGFFCPCHGSTFDASGRVFRNKPAPTNLPVPPHRYASDTRLIIGSSGAA